MSCALKVKQKHPRRSANDFYWADFLIRQTSFRAHEPEQHFVGMYLLHSKASLQNAQARVSMSLPVLRREADLQLLEQKRDCLLNWVS